MESLLCSFYFGSLSNFPNFQLAAMDIRRVLYISATAAMAFMHTSIVETKASPAESGDTTAPNSNAEFSGIGPYGAPNMLSPYTGNSFGSYGYGSGYGNNYQCPIGSPFTTPSIYGQYNPFGQLPVPQYPYPPSPMGGAFNPYAGYPNQGFGFGCTPVSVQGDATYCVSGPACSGSGFAPAGMNCPLAGSQAVGDCKPNLPSSRGGFQCILPMNSRCVQVNWNTWGCALY